MTLHCRAWSRFERSENRSVGGDGVGRREYREMDDHTLHPLNPSSRILLTLSTCPQPPAPPRQQPEIIGTWWQQRRHGDTATVDPK